MGADCVVSRLQLLKIISNTRSQYDLAFKKTKLKLTYNMNRTKRESFDRFVSDIIRLGVILSMGNG